MSSLNPVEKRVMHLAEDYLVFSSDKIAQVLIWQVDGDTRQMLQTMLTFHAEQSALTPDLILPAELPFEDPEIYENKLLQWLLSDLQESKEDLDAPLKTWNPDIPDDVASPLLSYLKELSELLIEHVRHVTLYFRFEYIDDFENFALWFFELIKNGLPERVQLAVFDDDNNTIANALKTLPEGMAMMRSPSIDMNKTIEETFSAGQASQPEGPEKDYQEEIVFAVTALRRKDYKTAFQRAQKAFQIAEKHDWWSMQMSALVVYGNAVLGKGDLEMAERCAQQALSVRDAAEDTDDLKMLDTLKTQALFLEANVFLLQKNWAEASGSYENAAEASARIGNVLMEFEGRRMAAKCRLENGEQDRCFSIGMGALSLAEKFPEDLKRDGTLPHLVQDLIHTAKAEQNGPEDLDERMVAIIGKDWRSEMAVA